MASDGKPAAGVAEAEHTLEQVLRRWPEHPGANHYYIHAVESSPTPERAVPSAQRLMGVVPWAGHMVHMPAHIWLVLGDYELAATVNQRAGQVDREYFAASNVTGAYNMYYVHNLHFVAYARSMQGRRAETVQAAKEMSEAILPAADAMPEMADAFLAVALLTQVRVQAWDEMLKMPQPAEKFLAQTAIWRYARVMALLAQGRRARAPRASATRSKRRGRRFRRIARGDDERVRRRDGAGGGDCGGTILRHAGGGAASLGEGGGAAGRAGLRRAARLVLSGARIAGRGAGARRPRRRRRRRSSAKA